MLKSLNKELDQNKEKFLKSESNFIKHLNIAKILGPSIIQKIPIDVNKAMQYLKGDLISEAQDELESSDSEGEDWRLGDYIGTGSIGNVYRAFDWASAKLIVIKFIDVEKLSEEDKDNFLDELNDYIDAIKQMKDNNIIRYLTVSIPEQEDKSIAISMEYVPGGSLSVLLKYFKCFKEPLVKVYI